MEHLLGQAPWGTLGLGLGLGLALEVVLYRITKAHAVCTDAVSRALVGTYAVVDRVRTVLTGIALPEQGREAITCNHM